MSEKNLHNCEHVILKVTKDVQELEEENKRLKKLIEYKNIKLEILKQEIKNKDIQVETLLKELNKFYT